MNLTGWVYQMVIIRMCDSLRTGKPPQYITNTKVNLAFYFSRIC